MPKNPLTPRETAMRLLEHMEEDASYNDIIRQVRILQDIDQTMSDAPFAGSQSESAVETARTITQRDEATGRRDTPQSSAQGSWTSLADRSDDTFDSILRRAVWVH